MNPLLDRFAAHLAHLLNSAGETVVLDAFQVRETLITTLSGSEYQQLVAANLAPRELGRRDVAESYLDCVLDRRLALKANEHTHNAHELFLLLCCRGVTPGWSDARLDRLRDAEPSTVSQRTIFVGASGEYSKAERPARTTGSALVPSDFSDVATRLGRLDGSISKGNPAKKTREIAGPLYLIAGDVRTQVADELSIWQAIYCAPPRLNCLETEQAFDELCSHLINTLQVANRPFGELVGLGLWPPHWFDKASLNEVRGARAFMATVRAPVGPDAAQHGDFSVWRAAWNKQKVPGYNNVEEFWRSDLGMALRSPHAIRLIDFDQAERELVDDDYEPDLCSESNFKAQLDQLLTAGIVEAVDTVLLTGIFERQSIQDLWTRADIKERFKSVDDLAQYVANLAERIAEATRKFDET